MCPGVPKVDGYVDLAGDNGLLGLLYYITTLSPCLGRSFCQEDVTPPSLSNEKLASAVCSGCQRGDQLRLGCCGVLSLSRVSSQRST